MAKKLWGGRFTKPLDAELEDFSRSIHYDSALAEFDVLHSVLHVKALRNAGLLEAAEYQGLSGELDKLLDEIRGGRFRADPDEEDIHSAVQNILQDRVGDTALKLHTLRSRNDQIAFDVKLYARRKAAEMGKKLTKLSEAFAGLAERYADTPFPGYTHTQRAQVLRFSDHCRAYGAMFERDGERLADYLRHVQVRIGAGALAGTSIPASAYAGAIRETDPEDDMKIRVAENPPEHVADRDFVIELLSICSIIQIHLSRYAEDMILYASAEFGYVDLPEEFCTGSSLMPHKKNADLLELIRGHSGTVCGDLTALLVTMKGLPLTYNRDMQLDKEPLFRSTELLLRELDLTARFVPGVRLREEKIAAALEDEHLYGVEIAEYLVHRKVPFKSAHDIVGGLIRYSEEHGVRIRDIPDAELAAFHPDLSREKLRKIMTPAYVIATRER